MGNKGKPAPSMKGKQAAPFKPGGGRDQTHKNTAKGTPRKNTGRSY